MKQIYITAMLAAAASISAVAAVPQDLQQTFGKQLIDSKRTEALTSWSNGKTQQKAPKMEVTREMKLKHHAGKVQTLAPTSERRSTTTRDDSEEFTVVFTVVAPEGCTIDYPTIKYYMDDPEFIYGYADVPWEWDGSPVLSEEPLIAGKYIIMCSANFETEEMVGNYYFYDTFELSPENCDVTIDLTKCTNHISFHPLMQNGEPYPTSVSDDEWPITMMSFEITPGDNDMLSGGTMGFGLGHWDTYVNGNLPEDAFVTYNVRYYDTDKMEGSTALWSVDGPFDKDLDVAIGPDDYKLLSTTFTLNEAEKAFDEKGFFQAMWFLSDSSNWGTESASGGPGSPFDEVSVYFATPAKKDTGIVRETVYGMGTAVASKGDDEYIYKQSGFFIRAEQDKWLLTRQNYKVYDLPDGSREASYISPCDVLNIDLNLQPIRNFYNTSFLSSYIIPYFDTESETWPIMDLMASIRVYGPFYETTELPKIWDCFKTIKYNGEILEGGIADLMGKTFLNSEIEFGLSYDGLVVCDKFKTSAEQVYTMKTANFADILVPTINTYKIVDEKGAIANVLKPGEKGTLYVNYVDYDTQSEVTGVADVKVEVAEQEAGEWTELTCTNVELDNVDGCLVTAVLDNEAIAENVWQKVRITITDAAGNINATTLNYAFIYGELGSVNTVSSAAEGVSTYFDLFGRKVVGADNGLYIKVTKFADGTSKTEKVMVK